MSIKGLFSEWQQALIVLFTGIFLLQYVVWFSEYWWSTTPSYVVNALILTCIIEVLPKIPWLLRRVLQVISILAMLMIKLDFKFISGKVESTRELLDLLTLHYIQIETYFWFAFIAWFAYIVCIWWVKEKSRIFILILASVILFSSVDSYSLLVLWDQVALLILCGLFMTIIRHFEQFKLKNPQSWSTIIEYPGTLTASIVIIISIVMAAGILMPGMNPFVTDPYTAWMNYKGQAVTTSGKGISQSPVAIASASSGYGRDDSQIGGGFNYDYSPVMTIISEYKSYWRGETKSFYNGRGWELSEIEKATVYASLSRNVLLPKEQEINKTLLKTQEVVQAFTMANDRISYAVLFGAYSINKLVTLGEGGGAIEGAPTAVLWSSRQEELRWPESKSVEDLATSTTSGKYPKTYSIISQMPIIDPEGLRTAPAQLVKAELWLDYLQLPEGLPERVKQLAEEITVDALNPYDKVKKIEDYLKTQYKYTNKPDHSQAQSADFVDSFLFEIKEGYCDYYSTAMTVLTRTIGIPARWVKGFSSGQNFDEEVLQNVPDFVREEIQSESNSYTIRNSNAHSWVEVYFEGYGWIPFEPTAGFIMPVTEEEKEIAPETADNEAAAVAESKNDSSWLSSMIIASIFLVMTSLIGILIWKFKLLGFIGAWKTQRREINLNQQVVVEFNRLLRFSKRRGYIRNDHETVRETVKRWVEHKRWIQKDFELLLGIFERAKYSSMNITDEEAAKAARIVKKLREQM